VFATEYDVAAGKGEGEGEGDGDGDGEGSTLGRLRHNLFITS
jgi:hypothetical protein